MSSDSKIVLKLLLWRMIQTRALQPSFLHGDFSKLALHALGPGGENTDLQPTLDLSLFFFLVWSNFAAA